MNETKQTMDVVTKRVIDRLAERPVQDTMIYAEEVRYCWVDEVDQRVSPVHKDFGKALSWISNWPDLVARLESWRNDTARSPWPHSEDSIEKLERSISLTGRPPSKLKRVVIRTVGEPIADYEVEATRRALSATGLS